MRFFGNTMYFPHVDGGFTQFKTIDTAQYIPSPQQADEKVMAFAEPLAVAIHAAHEAGDLQGKRVFISGVGPIGCLIVSAVKTLGAAEVACADISARALSGPADGRWSLPETKPWRQKSSSFSEKVK